MLYAKRYQCHLPWLKYSVEQNNSFWFCVPDRTEATWLALITRHITDGSIITSDMWKGYYNIRNCGLQHRVVNQSLNFVDPLTHADTNTIGGFWSTIKRKLKYIYGSQSPAPLHSQDGTVSFAQLYLVDAQSARQHRACRDY